MEKVIDPKNINDNESGGTEYWLVENNGNNVEVHGVLQEELQLRRPLGGGEPHNRGSSHAIPQHNAGGAATQVDGLATPVCAGH